MKYVKKPVVIEAITFDELVAHGISQGVPLTRGMPWSFDFNGHPITHENDDCYLIPTLEGVMKMGREDMLITGIKGEIYPCKRDIFEATYAAAERDKVSEQCDDFMRSLGVDALGVDAEIWAQPSAHGNDRLRWAVLICQKIEERKKERDEQAEAVRVLAGECCEWRVAHVCSPVSLIDAPIIRARKRTMNNPIARAAVEGER